MNSKPAIEGADAPHPVVHHARKPTLVAVASPLDENLNHGEFIHIVNNKGEQWVIPRKQPYLVDSHGNVTILAPKQGQTALMAAREFIHDYDTKK